MPAYPFAPAPTYAELKQAFQDEFNCKLLKLDHSIRDLQGNEHPIYYFEREHEGKIYRVVAPDLQNDDRVLYSVTRSLCNKLRIPPARFGLVLG
jgi:hypothetical protein